MNIGIIGIGGIGGYLGAHLARHFTGSGTRVSLLARGAMLQAVRKRGLTLESAQETFTACPAAASERAEDLGRLDLALLCTKTYHLDEVAQQIAPVIGPETIVISLLNGVDNAERLRAHLPEARVLNGAIYISAAVQAPGVVRHVSGPGRVIFGADDGQHERSRPTAALLREAGIAAEYREDVRWAVWEKYLFIEPIGSTTSYYGKNFGEVVNDPEAWALEEGLLSELERLAAAEGIALPEGIHAATLDKVRGFAGPTKTSMQVDFEKRRPTELETFTGYVVRAAGRHGLPVPLHERVYENLRARSA